MSKPAHAALYSFELPEFFSLDGFLFNEHAGNGVGLSLAEAAVEAALLEHGPDGPPATLPGGDGLLLIGEHVDDHAGVGLGIAQAALDEAPVGPDLTGLVPWSLSGSELTGPRLPEPASARPTFTVDAGGVTVLEPQLSGAKGGVPGPPSGGGDDDGGGDGGGDGGLLTNYFSGSADGEAGYDIWIEFKGSDWKVEIDNVVYDLQQAFIDAADYFTTVIADDIGGGGRYRGKTIDDLYVTAELKAIDGVGNVLGQAGPTAVWTDTQLTAAGMMEFDIADVGSFYDKGLWDDIVTHEMMHVLGFGSLWDYGRHAALVDGEQYTGANALAAYNNDDRFGPAAEFIPVEIDGGSGTAGAHWDEGALDNELMTGFIDSNNYLSEFSVMALADLGYEVTYQDYPYDDVLVA